MHFELLDCENLKRNAGPSMARRARKLVPVVVVSFVLAGIADRSYSQGLMGTLSGIVTDQTEAVVPRAEVTLRDDATGATRRTESNAEGFFTISNVPAGVYTVTIEAKGFSRWQRTGIRFHPGDRIHLPDISLAVGGLAEVVVVEANPDVAVPVDSGEKSAVITSKQIQNLGIVGRNAVELLKVLPGVVNHGGSTGFVGYTGETVSFGSGLGSYHVAGTRNDALDIVSDGANVIDPGCNCGSAVTANVELVQEVKVQVANFSAENTKGPTVIQTVSKSGTSSFHGEGYVYLRNHRFNSADWQNNRYDTEKPASKYLFPGFNLGGPLTKGRDKLFFFAGFEWMRQDVDLGTTNNLAVVPTEAMRRGDFSDTAYLAQLNGYDINLVPRNDAEQDAEGLSHNTGRFWGQNPLTPEMLSGGVISPSAIDPGGQILMNLYPLPNRDPATNNGFNYISSIVNPQNRAQQLVRIDYNISDATKLYTRFNHETETIPYPYTLWWNNPNQVPGPSRLIGGNRSYSTSTSLVNVLSPTTTNEVIFAATYLNLPNRYEEPDKVSRSALGYPYEGVFKNGVEILPALTDWSGGVATLLQPGGFNPELFANKWLISIGDNFSKVQGKHFLKFGAYFQHTTNDQPTSDFDQGLAVPTQWGGLSTGNAYADLLMGRIGYYQESSKNPVGLMRQNELSFYAQDNWKATRRLTLELGARFYHYGWMYDREGRIAGFDASLYDPNVQYSGIITHAGGGAIPRSGFVTPALRVGPRFGFALDLTGKGSTVLRGGVGGFYYRDQGNVFFGAIGNPPVKTNTTIGYYAGRLSDIDATDPTAFVPTPNLIVLDHKDDRVPKTYSWSLTLSRRLPFATVLEASYVGNTSRHQIFSPDDFNINAVPEGAMFGFRTDRCDETDITCRTDPNNYRPFQGYGSIGLSSHLSNQHYHSFQLTANRQTGRINYSLAYTFGKVLGIGGGLYMRGSDQFDRRGRSYGPLEYDRTHTLSVAYNLFLPDPTRTPVLREILNGWQLSGISVFQSGGPIERDGRTINVSGTMAGGSPVLDSNGNVIGLQTAINSTNVHGTPDAALGFTLLCDPRDGLDTSVSGNFTDRQYFNPACFGAPTPGGPTTYRYPYLKEPKFLNHDFSIFKNFPLSSKHEDIKLQFRASAFNILNHPTPIFLPGDPGLQLNYVNGVLDENSMRNFGRPTNKVGHRIIQFALKFMF